jgi:predicted RNase H-like HicB family nuclease
MVRQPGVRVVHATMGIPVAPSRVSPRSGAGRANEAGRRQYPSKRVGRRGPAAGCPRGEAGREAPGAGGRCPGQGSGKAATRRVRRADASWKRRPSCGSRVRSGFQGRGVRSDSPDAPAATAPRLDARWEFYPISTDVASALKSKGKSAMVPRAGMGKTMMTTFTAYIEFDEESQLYVGVVPGVPGAHTQASSLDELRANLQEVLELCLEEQGELRARPPKFVGVQQIEVA